MAIVRTCTKVRLRAGNVLMLLGVAVGSCFISTPAFAETNVSLAQEEVRQENLPVEDVQNVYVLGKVLAITEEGTEGMQGFEDTYQTVLVKVQSGKDAGDVITIEYRSSAIGFEQFRLKKGDTLVLVQSSDAQGMRSYSILERFRLSTVAFLGVLFAVLAVVFGRWKGLMSLVGLGVSIIVLVGFVVPRIMAGDNPVLICGIGSFIIALTSIFLAHGFTRRTAIAFSSTMLVLIAAFVLSHVTIVSAMLSGANSEEAMYLQMGYLQSIDLRGLLLGGLVIGTLGVLDDVTTAQVAAVEEIFKANRTLKGKELYKRGISVGREHIASLVNTLALAYVGASFPLFLLFSLPDNPPLWVIMNGESIAVELLRAFIGGAALILAVPVSTALATWGCERGFMGKEQKNTQRGHSHHHA